MARRRWPGTGWVLCPTCNGIPQETGTHGNSSRSPIECPTCRWVGWVREDGTLPRQPEHQGAGCSGCMIVVFVAIVALILGVSTAVSGLFH